MHTQFPLPLWERVRVRGQRHIRNNYVYISSVGRVAIPPKAGELPDILLPVGVLHQQEMREIYIVPSPLYENFRI